METSSELVEIARDLSPPAVTESRTSIIRKSGLSDLTVRISQHSSLDRDQYLSYKSSLSSQSIFASRPSYLETESGESLLVPLSDIQSEPKPCQSDIFPDSQSAAGSSSYVPTSSTFLNEASSNDSAEGDSPHSNSPNTRTNHSGFSSSVRSNTNQTCQIVPSTTVSASQDFLRSQRADSAPLQSSPTALQPTSLVEVEATQVFRSRLDSPSIISDSLGRGSSHLTQETVSSSRGLDPRWSLRQFHPTREFGVDDLDLGINFQTQTSLALGSQPNLGSSESIGKRTSVVSNPLSNKIYQAITGRVGKLFVGLLIWLLKFQLAAFPDNAQLFRKIRPHSKNLSASVKHHFLPKPRHLARGI